MNQLILGDCLEVLKKLDSESVDLTSGKSRSDYFKNQRRIFGYLAATSLAILVKQSSKQP